GHWERRRAAGRSRWPPRSVSPQGSPPGSSATKPFGWPSAACGCRGSGRNIGSRVPLRRLPEKKRRDQLIQRAMVHPSWALGFGDEVWWSRLAQPNQHGRADGETPYQVAGPGRPPGDPDPKALACYGLLRPGPLQADQMWLRFVTGRPVSAVTIEFLAWGSGQLAAQGFTALLLIWDN